MAQRPQNGVVMYLDTVLEAVKLEREREKVSQDAQETTTDDDCQWQSISPPSRNWQSGNQPGRLSSKS